MKILDTEIQRARHCRTSVSFCLLKIEFDEKKSDLDSAAKDRIIRSVGDIFTEEIRDWDTLHQYDGQSFALLMPQTPVDEAQLLCNHLKRISAESISQTDGFSAKLKVGWAEYSHENDDTGADLFSRASAEIQMAGRLPAR